MGNFAIFLHVLVSLWKQRHENIEANMFVQQNLHKCTFYSQTLSRSQNYWTTAQKQIAVFTRSFTLECVSMIIRRQNLIVLCKSTSHVCCDPSLEQPQWGCSNEGSQHTCSFLWRNKTKFHRIFLKNPTYLQPLTETASSCCHYSLTWLEILILTKCFILNQLDKNFDVPCQTSVSKYSQQGPEIMISNSQNLKLSKFVHIQ